MQYLGVTQDKTMAVEISQPQFSIYQTANGQFCSVYAPLQLLANPPSCITALYAKNVASISTRCSLKVRKAQSISIPSSIAQKMWILTSACSTVTPRITLISPGRNNKIYHSTETHPHFATTSCLQCCITTLSFTTTI